MGQQAGRTGRAGWQERAELERLLPGPGDHPRALRRVRPRFLIPRNRLPAVLSRAIEGCRAATREHVTLPAGEGVDVEFVPDLAWSCIHALSGSCDESYSDQLALPLTVDRVLDLACHEAYPGHHTID
jgi:hypothetical protein